MLTHFKNSYGFLINSLHSRYGNPILGDILITMRCPVKCRFCIYGCNLQGDDMSIDDIEKISLGFKKMNVKNVRIVGGEPFFTYDLLLESFDIIKKYFDSDKITIITAPIWSPTKSRAEKLLKPLIDGGLKNIQISIDAFHLERIPLQNYINALSTLNKFNLNVVLNIIYTDRLYPYLHDFSKIIKSFDFKISLGLLFPLGKAKELPKEDLYHNKNKFLEFKGALSEAIQKNKFDYKRSAFDKIKIFSCHQLMVLPNGDVYFCCMKMKNSYMGNIHDENLEKIYDNSKSHWIGNLKSSIKFSIKLKTKEPHHCLMCPFKFK